MQTLNLPDLELTPAVEFNKEKNIFRIEGKSLLDNPTAFFEPIKQWFQNYKSEPNPETALVIKFEYFNIATSRELLDIFKILETLPNAKIIWHFLEDDEDMEESGQELAELVKVPFDFQPY